MTVQTGCSPLSSPKPTRGLQRQPAARRGKGCGKGLLPGKPVAYNRGLLWLKNGLSWRMVKWPILLAYLAFQVVVILIISPYQDPNKGRLRPSNRPYSLSWYDAMVLNIMLRVRKNVRNLLSAAAILCSYMATWSLWACAVCSM